MGVPRAGLVVLEIKILTVLEGFRTRFLGGANCSLVTAPMELVGVSHLLYFRDMK